MDLKLLKKLYEIHSPSGDEKRMKRYIKRYAGKEVKTETDKYGNLYMTKGEADTYPCVVAHLDQVQTIHSRDFKTKMRGYVLYGYSKQNKQQEGLGADDKNGIWVALQCLRSFDNIKVAFFVEEEWGCCGSDNANLEFFDNCRFVIQCDRQGQYDLVHNIYGIELCSKEFLQDIDYKRYGYMPTHGALTDVYTLRRHGLNISCINMSCGYYYPHTDEEVTDYSQLCNCLLFVMNIIETCTKTYSVPTINFQDDAFGTFETEYDF